MAFLRGNTQGRLFLHNQSQSPAREKIKLIKPCFVCRPFVQAEPKATENTGCHQIIIILTHTHAFCYLGCEADQDLKCKGDATNDNSLFLGCRTYTSLDTWVATIHNPCLSLAALRALSCKPEAVHPGGQVMHFVSVVDCKGARGWRHGRFGVPLPPPICLPWIEAVLIYFLLADHPYNLPWLVS